MPLLSKFLQRGRMAAVKKYVKGSVLDIGCGQATVFNDFEKGQKYVGIEYDKNVVTDLRKKYRRGLFFFKNLETDSFSGIPGKFETVLLIAVIEHLSNPENALSEIRKYTKKDGKIIITTLTPFANRLHKVGAFLGLFSKSAVKNHKKIYDYIAMEKLLEANGLKIASYRKFELGLNQVFVTLLDK